MATVAQIEIVVDNEGAVTALQQLGAEGKKLDPVFQKVGQRGNLVMTQMRKDHEKARDAVQLLSNTIGVQVPRSLEKVIARTPGVAAALRGAFEITVIAAFGVAIIKMVSNLDDARIGLNKFAETARIARSQLAEIFGGEVGWELQRQRVNRQLQITLPLLSAEMQLGNQATLATLQGLAAIEEKRSQARAGIHRLAQDQITAARAAFSTAREFDQAERSVRSVETQALAQADRAAAAERIVLARQAADQTREIENQSVLARLTGIDAITEKERQAVAEDKRLLDLKLITKEDFERRKTAIENQSNTERTKLEHQIHAEGQQAILQAEAASREGREQIEKEYLAALQEITQQEQVLQISLEEKRVAAAIDRDNKLRSLEKERLNELLDLETAAALAILPPWERADAEIVASAHKRIREIEQRIALDKNFQRQGAREIVLIWQETFAQMRDHLAESLEGLFDDITSGNIGKRFLNNFKRLVFQMIAEWLTGLAKMRAASGGILGGGAGGILGAIFSGLLGIPNIFGASTGGSASTSAASAGAGGFSSAGAGAGIPGLGLSFGNGLSGPGAAIPGLPLGPGTAAAGGVLSLAGGLSAGGGARSALSLPAGASFGARLGQGLAGLIPGGALSLAQLIGFGGAGQGLVSGALTAAGLGSIFAIATGASFGVGATASLAAFFSSVAGLATLGIGAIVGLLFGIFGGRKKKRERERLENQLIGEIRKVEDAYKNHQLDFDSTIGQLEQLRAQFVDAQKKVGGGPHRRVHSHIDQAESEIRAIEDERKRRQEVVFGPAEFHRGGYVSQQLASISPGRPGARAFHSGDIVNANLLVGESVLNRSATARIGKGGVDQLNAGGFGGIGSVTVNGPLIQAEKVDEHWLRNGGAKQIIIALRRATAEGAW